MIILCFFYGNAVFSKNTELKWAIKNLGDHTHVLLLEIIPPQSLGQILARHFLSGTFLNGLCEFLDCHAPAA